MHLPSKNDISIFFQIQSDVFTRNSSNISFQFLFFFLVPNALNSILASSCFFFTVGLIFFKPFLILMNTYLLWQSMNHCLTCWTLTWDDHMFTLSVFTYDWAQCCAAPVLCDPGVAPRITVTSNTAVISHPWSGDQKYFSQILHTKNSLSSELWIKGNTQNRDWDAHW